MGIDLRIRGMHFGKEIEELGVALLERENQIETLETLEKAS